MSKTLKLSLLIINQKHEVRAVYIMFIFVYTLISMVAEIAIAYCIHDVTFMLTDILN